jgi:hypothetical protein
VIRQHHKERMPGLVEANFNALLECALEIGAKDMLEDVTPPPALALALAPVAVT